MLKHFLILQLVLVLAKTDSSTSTLANKSKLVIDNDAGADDAMAIFMALLYEEHFNGPKLVALTTTHGNTIEEKVCVNNQRILKVAKREDVPIFRGANKSLVFTPSSDSFYGSDGLGDAGDIPKHLVEAQKKRAVNALLELSKTYEGELILVSLGSLTNVALAMSLDPDFLGRLKHLYVGAGYVKSETFPKAEFNARTDAEAYHIVANASGTDKVTVVPYSTTQLTLNIEKSWRTDVFGAIETDIVRALNSYEKISINKKKYWSSLDPATVAVFLKPELISQIQRSKNNIDLCGDTRGIVNNEFESKDSNVNVIEAIDKEAYKKFLMDVFSADQKNETR